MAITRQTRAQEDKAAARQKLGAEHKSPQANLTFGTEAKDYQQESACSRWEGSLTGDRWAQSARSSLPP